MEDLAATQDSREELALRRRLVNGSKQIEQLSAVGAILGQGMLQRNVLAAALFVQSGGVSGEKRERIFILLALDEMKEDPANEVHLGAQGPSEVSDRSLV